jgi:tellurite methyltransferase
MKNVSEYWNRIHSEFEFKTEQQSIYAEEKEKLFPVNSTVVDIGAGQGADAEFFLQHGHPVILIDASSVALEQAKDRIAKAGLEKGFNIVKTVLGEENIDLPDSSTDIIYSRLALH